MPLVQECSHAGCSTLTMGPYCIEHEPAAAGRPAPPSRRLAALTGLALAGLAAALLARVRLPV